MKTSKPYDIAILGGGCTALNFAMAYAQSDCQKTFLIIEGRSEYVHDRNWSFWLHQDHNFQHRDILKKTWKSWSFSNGNKSIRHVSDNYEYVTIASGDFYKKAQDIIAGDDRQALMMGCDVKDVTSNDNHIILTSRGEFEAKYIIDARNSKTNDFKNRADFYQIFFGYEVEKENAFDPASAGIMEGMQNIQGGVSFIYALPYSKDRALIEYTQFTAHHVVSDKLEKHVQSFTDQKLGQSGYKIISKEHAVLPMGEVKSDHPKASDTYMYAGTMAGGLRESSGYGFLRLYHWAQQAVNQINAGYKPLPGCVKQTFISQFMDRHFIKTLMHSPEYSERIFMGIAEKVDADSFARFMADEHSMRDCIKIIAAVPKIPFIKALSRK